jgi:hypothetical protein
VFRRLLDTKWTGKRGIKSSKCGVDFAPNTLLYSERIRHKLKGKALLDAESYIIGTSCVSKSNVLRHINKSKAHDAALAFAKTDEKAIPHPPVTGSDDGEPCSAASTVSTQAASTSGSIYKVRVSIFWTCSLDFCEISQTFCMHFLLCCKKCHFSNVQ